MVITVIMAGILLGSLGLAYALTVRQHRRSGLPPSGITTTIRPTSVRDLRLGVPASWTAGPSPDVLSLTSAARFVDPTVPDRQLTVGVDRFTVVRDPATVFRSVFSKLLTGANVQRLQTLHQLRPIKTGPFSGVRYSGLANTPDGPQLHLLAVFTQDTRQSWVIHLRHTLSDQSLVFDAFRSDDALLTLILNQTSSLAYRQATAEDAQAVGLSGQLPQAARSAGLEASTRQQALPQEPLRLTPIPDSDEPGFLQLRIRAEADAGIDDPSHPLSPTALLSRRYLEAAGKALPAGGVQRVAIDGRPAWLTSQVLSDNALIRHVCYARIEPGRGVLIEAIADMTAARDALTKIESLIAQPSDVLLEPLPESPQISSIQDVAGFEQAIAQGEKIARDSIRRLVASPAPAWRYELVSTDGYLLAGYVDHVWRDSEQSPAVLRGRAQFLYTAQGQHWVKQRWEVTDDGEQFSFQWQNTSGPDAAIKAYRLERNGPRLTLFELLPGEKQEAWSADVPRGYLPPLATDQWPTDPQFLSGPRVGIVWTSLDEKPPSPVWVHRIDHTPGQDTSPTIPDQTQYVAMIRPVMEIDGVYRAIGQSGQILKYATQRIIPLTGGGWFEFQSVDRQQLIEALPEMVKIVTQWEQSITDETP